MQNLTITNESIFIQNITNESLFTNLNNFSIINFISLSSPLNNILYLLSNLLIQNLDNYNATLNVNDAIKIFNYVTYGTSPPVTTTPSQEQSLVIKSSVFGILIFILIFIIIFLEELKKHKKEMKPFYIFLIIFTILIMGASVFFILFPLLHGDTLKIVIGILFFILLIISIILLEEVKKSNKTIKRIHIVLLAVLIIAFIGLGILANYLINLLKL